MKAQLPLYRHKELYHDNDMYTIFRYVSKSEFEKFKSIRSDICGKFNRAIDEKGSRWNVLNFRPDLEYCVKDQAAVYDTQSINSIKNYVLLYDSPYYDFKLRYSYLNTTGYFYWNIHLILGMLQTSKNRFEFRITCELMGIPENIVNYAIVYACHSPGHFIPGSRFAPEELIEMDNLEDLFKDTLNNASSTKPKPYKGTWGVDFRTLILMKRLRQEYADIMENNKEIASFKEFQNTKLDYKDPIQL